ncbi:hypothetical protein [[Eubacterium] cellulosolvens]
MRTRRTQALTVRSGPTRSGKPAPSPAPVAGEMLPIDKLSLFLANSWIIILLILIVPVTYLLYRKRDATLKFLHPLVSRLFEYTHRL